MKRLTLAVAFALFGGICAQTHAAVSDDASNYAGSWTNGSNGGTGFYPWSISNNNNGGPLFAGSFIGDSTAGAGNINTSGVSFGLYANPVGAVVDASRAFTAPLASGDVFTFQLALNFDTGIKGFDLHAGSQGTVFNFIVGGGGVVSSPAATLNPGSGLGYNYGGSDAVLTVTISVTSATAFSYDISRTSSLGFQGTLFGGTVSNLTDDIDSFAFYVAFTDAGGAAENNLYINNLSVTGVIPEPSTYAALVGLVVLSWAAFSRRRRG